MYLMMATAILPVCALLNSCDKGDDGGSNGSSSGSLSPGHFVGTDGKEVLLTSASPHSFQYDDSGKLTVFTFQVDYEDEPICDTVKICYNPLAMTYATNEETSGYDYGYEYNITVSVNKQGFITELTSRHSDIEGFGEYTEIYTASMEYDTDGHLLSISEISDCTYAKYPQYDLTVTKMTWENDKIIKIYYEWREDWNYSGESKSITSINVITYDYENANLNGTLQNTSGTLPYYRALYLEGFWLTGYLGAGSKYLPSSCTDEYYEFDNENNPNSTYSKTSTNTYTYTFNANGTIATEIETNEKGKAYKTSYAYSSISDITKSAAETKVQSLRPLPRQ